MQRGFMLCTSVYFQSGDVNAALLLYVARQTVAGPRIGELLLL